MKLYTGHGDKGETSLVGGERVMKDDERICACGDLDELNANVGMMRSIGVPQEHDLWLRRIQELLFHIGAELSNSSLAMASQLSKEDITQIEHCIDELQAATPDPHTFVLPSGCLAATQSHVCRTIARRTERAVVHLTRTFHVNDLIIEYLNRLSDYFFALALYLNFITSVEENKLYISCK